MDDMDLASPFSQWRCLCPLIISTGNDSTLALMHDFEMHDQNLPYGDDMTLTLELSLDLETRLSQEAAVLGLPVEKYAIGVLEQSCPEASRREGLAAELQVWIDAASTEPPNDDVLHQLDADCPSNRRLYPPELKGVTW